MAPIGLGRQRSDSNRNNSQASNTFAPKFIKTEELQGRSEISGIEGENDFSGKRYVWLRDPEAAFIRGWVVEDMEGGRLKVQCDDDTVNDGPYHVFK